MYFWFFKLKKWGKKTAETRRRNCAVLPQQKCNNLSFANSRCGGFELRFCHVWEKCTASAQYSSNLGNKAVLVGTHSLCPAIFSASSGCAAPPQLHIAPLCPQQSCCGLLRVFGTSLPFSTSVSLKFPHFKFTEVFMSMSRSNLSRLLRINFLTIRG